MFPAIPATGATVRAPHVQPEEPSRMRAPSRVALLAAALVLSSACGPRQVEVRTAPTSAQTEQSVRVTNNLSQAVNVYVTTSGGGELFLRQIPANTVEVVPVPSVAPGTMAIFKAVTVDGARTYQSQSVALSGQFRWSVVP
jgi:hypothetical protein